MNGGAWRQEAAALGRLAGPLVLSQLAQVGMTALDTWMVAPLGPDALAAVGLGGALHVGAWVISGGVLLGMTPLVSQAAGAGANERAAAVWNAGLLWAALLSVPLGAVSLFGEVVALALGQSPDVAANAGAYLRGLLPGVPALLLFFAARQYLEGLGRSRPPMVLMLLGLGLNALLNRVLIYGVPGGLPAYGFVGSAYATSAVRVLLAVGALAYVYGNPAMRPRMRWPDGALVAAVGRIGAPAALMLGVEIALFTGAALLVGRYGAVALGAHQLVTTWTTTTFMAALGVALAGGIRVGHHLGVRRSDGVRRAVVLTYGGSLGVMALCAAAFALMPRPLLGLFTDDPRMLDLGARLLGMATVFQLFDGAQVAGACLLRGAADTRVPMVLAAVAYLGVGLPTAYALGELASAGPLGVWWGKAMGLGTAALLLALRVRGRLLGAASLRPVAVAIGTE